jgi:hypothetical protein
MDLKNESMVPLATLTVKRFYDNTSASKIHFVTSMVKPEFRTEVKTTSSFFEAW